MYNSSVNLIMNEYTIPNKDMILTIPNKANS